MMAKEDRPGRDGSGIKASVRLAIAGRWYLSGIVLPLAFAMLLYPGRSSGASVEDIQSWTNITATGAVFPTRYPPQRNLLYWLEVQPRFGSDLSRLSQSIVRAGLGLPLTSNSSLWLGYAWIDTRAPLTAAPFPEQRIWQQILWSKNFTKLGIVSRTRLEERHFPSPSPMAFRVRQLLKLILPLHPEAQWNMVLNNEYFWHINSVPGRLQRGFDQNRLFAGAGYRASKHLVIEAGYMNQYINRVSALHFMGNIICVNLLLTY
ncbi:MAG: DUF2490 domain-containing protein [Legionellaceae bacterium]|nr:DUF2490 domain-containing protein [Legionellaceae bacterium]